MTQPALPSHRGARRLPPLLAGFAIIAAGLAVLLAGAFATSRYPFAFDRSIILGLRQWHGPVWLPKVAADITALGGGVVLTLVVLLVVGFLLAQRLWLTALAIAFASLTGGWAVDLIKGQVLRARPDLVPHLVDVSGYSFPSGHATSSAIVYLTLAALAGQVTPERTARRYLLVAAVLLVGAIGCSRVYLGVHWPSDVLAGWSFGTLWALGWWTATAQARMAIGGER
ncbi:MULTISPECIES: phosphatase PAP2 family protein [unclassified Sphingomonas]|jgi:membrane-associated phospholipid phosphatase|uniref:phosphatase PAP2 family protein n=1 Tax=unclassified Sphingomonas TaxID=196159 RepID=UPI0025D38CF1|nr:MULTISPECIES: phosphatase PAP2 family protein [unclassified Sphingomonas]